MDIAASECILKGRPSRGVAILWHKSLNRCFKFVQSDPNGRCLVSTLKCDHKSMLIFNLYLPCYDASAEYRAEIAFYVGFIENALYTVTFTDVINMGDMNFEVSYSGYDLLNHYCLVIALLIVTSLLSAEIVIQMLTRFLVICHVYTTSSSHLNYAHLFRSHELSTRVLTPPIIGQLCFTFNCPSLLLIPRVTSIRSHLRYAGIKAISLSIIIKRLCETSNLSVLV